MESGGGSSFPRADVERVEKHQILRLLQDEACVCTEAVG